MSEERREEIERVEEAEKIRKLVEFRKRLEKRIEETEEELKETRILLEFIDTNLLEKGFKRAEIAKPTQTIPTPTEIAAEAKEVPLPPKAADYESTVPLKTVTGVLLATLYLSKDSMHVALAEDKQFKVNTPPFMAFLVERVLAKMQERDQEAARNGEITPDRILSYNITRDGEILREIIIRNITPDRSRELKSSIRWTLEKMYEKMTESG